MKETYFRLYFFSLRGRRKTGERWEEEGVGMEGRGIVTSPPSSSFLPPLLLSRLRLYFFSTKSKHERHAGWRESISAKTCPRLRARGGLVGGGGEPEPPRPGNTPAFFLGLQQNFFI